MYEPFNQIPLESLTSFLYIFAVIAAIVSCLLALACVAGISLQKKDEASSKPAFSQKSSRFGLLRD